MIARILVYPRLDLATFWKRPILIVLFLIMTLLSFGAVLGGVRISSGSADTGGPKLEINSEFNVAFADAVFLGIILPFFVAIVCGMPILSDFDRRVMRILSSTPLSTKEYVFSRFLGSVTAVLLVIAAWLPFQIFFYELLPYNNPDQVRGAFRLMNYLVPVFLFILPTVFFIGGVSLWFGVRTRQPVLVFALPVIVLIAALFFLWSFAPEWLPRWVDRLLMAIDATGVRWLLRTYIAEDRGVAFYNSARVAPDFLFLASRIALVAIGFIAAWRAARRIDRAEYRDRRVGDPKALLESSPKAEATLAAAVLARGGLPSSKVSRVGFLGATATVLRFESRALVFSPGIWLFAPLILIQVYAEAAFRPGTLDTENLITTGTAAAGAFRVMTLLLLLLTLFYTVESLVREERCGMSGIFRATPIGTGAILTGKILANSVLAFAIVFAAILGTLIVLVVQRFSSGFAIPFEADVALLIFGPLLLPTIVLWCSFVAFLYAALRNRFVVYGVGLGALLLTGLLTRGGYLNWMTSWHLWDGILWSELDRLGIMWQAIVANRIVALSAAVFFIALTLGLWPRRTPDLRGIFDRLRPRSFFKATMFVVVAALPMIVAGTYTGISVRRGFGGGPAADAAKDYWRRNSKTWENRPFAALDRVDAEVAIFPDRRLLDSKAVYTIRNPHKEPMDEIALTVGAHFSSKNWTVDGVACDPENKDASIVRPSIENRSLLYVVRPERPLPEGGVVRVAFEMTGQFPNGWSKLSSGAAEFVLPSGVCLTTFSPSFLPVLGFSDGIGIDEKNGRDAEEFPVDFWQKRLDPRFGPAWPTHVRMAVVGPADWTLNSVGVPVESNIDGDRKRTVWETDQPVRFFNIVGGPLVEAKGDVSSVFHSPRTPWNVPTMVKALDAARRRYSEWFGPYPWRDLKLTQFPGLAGYAQGFPGNISFSESIGFLSKPAGDSDDDLDSAFYIVAHEAGHQWFGNKVTPGAGPGGNIISEGLANFAALMLSCHELGDRERQVLLRRWESSYALARRADAERPIHRTDGSRPGDETVTYDRAGFVFWMLRELMGEEAMLAGLRAFIEKFKNGPDYPVIEDLLESLRPEAKDVAAFDDFARQWILGKALPEFETTTPTASFDGVNWVIRGDIKNIGTGITSVVVRVEGKEPEQKRAMIGGETVRAQFLDTPIRVAPGETSNFTILTAFRPRRILVDPEVRLLHIGRKRTEKAIDVKE